jgi:RecB family exonuclease
MNCPPSFDMERHAPKEEPSEDADSGTRIHAVLALFASENTLNTAEFATFEMCAEQAERVFSEWGGTDTTPATREQRLGLTSLGTVLDVTPDSKASFIFTGQADLILIKDDSALVIDYKTGRGDTAEAVHNAQLASLAVLVWKRFRVSAVRVVIIQPWAGKPTVADYTTNALTLAEGWLQNTLLQASTSTPEEARAGEHCKWCKAKAGCSAYREAALSQIEVVNPMTIAGMDDETQRSALFARAMDMPAERLAASMRGLGMVKRFVSAFEGAAKERAANDAEFQRFFTLREKKGRRSVSDVGTVFQRCHERGVTAEQFTAVCSVPLGEVKELVKGATGLKGKALESAVSAVLEGACDTGKPSFELVAAGELEGGQDDVR